MRSSELGCWQSRAIAAHEVARLPAIRSVGITAGDAHRHITVADAATRPQSPAEAGLGSRMTFGSPTLQRPSAGRWWRLLGRRMAQADEGIAAAHRASAAAAYATVRHLRLAWYAAQNRRVRHASIGYHRLTSHRSHEGAPSQPFLPRASVAEHEQMGTRCAPSIPLAEERPRLHPFHPSPPPSQFRSTDPVRHPSCATHEAHASL